MNAPIALFAHRRPQHLGRCLKALAANPEAATSDLTLYVDGPRSEAERSQVEAVRDLARSARGFATVTCVFRKENLGLSRSILQGLGEQLAGHESVIVVEDDLVVSPHFLRFMNDGLATYREEEEVVSIHGYVYPVEETLPETFLLRGADCWGWATWARAWKLFNPDGAELLRALDAQGLGRAFDFDGHARYRAMLRAQIEGRNDSWAVRWYASAFLAGKFTLYPGRTLVENIGSDGSGTHDTGIVSVAGPVALGPLRVERLAPVENAEARRVIVRYFRRSVPGPLSRLLGLLWRRLRRGG